MFVVEFQLSFVGKAAEDASSANRRTSLSVGSMAGPIPSVSDCFHQIAGPEARESHPSPRHSFQVLMMDVRGFTGERLRTGKIKLNGEGCGRGQGATSRVRVTQLLFKSVSGVCLTAVP